MDLEKPKKAAVSNCVRRNILDLATVSRAWPAAPSPPYLMLAFVEEAAEVGIFMNLKEVAQKKAGLMHDTPVGDAFADFAAMSRGVKDEDGRPRTTLRCVTTASSIVASITHNSTDKSY
jgi:hypothetical protein